MEESTSDKVVFGDILPLLPLRGTIVFPYMVIPLDVGREKSINAVEEAMLKDRVILLSAQRDSAVAEPVPSDIHEYGCAAEIKQLVKIPNGVIRILVEGLTRVKIADYVQMEPFFKVKIERLQEDEEITPEIEALMRTVIYQFEQCAKLSKKVPLEIVPSVTEMKEPGRLADVIASQVLYRVEDKQEIMEAVSAKERLEVLCRILNREVEVLELEKKIQLRVRKQMEKTQKEYYLREQLKAIQKELGEKDEKAVEIEGYKKKIKQGKFPSEVRKRLSEEVDKLAKIPSMSAESVVVRNYIDWILALPWSIRTKDELDIVMAEKILDEDHYALEKVKERIIEYLAVRQLSNKIRGPILCLVGPPGVGKTSLAKSIARAMKRNFVRFSLGGVRDEAEIRGHRRTYVGALPGKIVQIMKKAGSLNPVVLLDEIDKMSMDFRGDPSSALLEVLDPEQNCEFVDHYLELPFDLSEVMFITTANVLYNIPRPLQDRMEIITIPGYIEEEKANIAHQFLIAKQKKENGLENDQLVISKASVLKMIRDYTREAGVRELERLIAAVCRKSARKIAKNEAKKVYVTPKKVEAFLGIPKYHYGMAEKDNQVGVVTGLAWTQVGGDVLTIETTILRGKGSLILTGKLGDVMKESAQAGFSYIRSRQEQLGIKANFHEEYDIHVHVPEGAIPKDGPSAGISMATSIASALMNKPVRADVAMSGEITLRGRVLPVGGIKEKVLAAHRAGIKLVILPKDNKRELEEVPIAIRKQMDFLLVEHMDEVLREAIVGLADQLPEELTQISSPAIPPATHVDVEPSEIYQ
jgi:ATP-dependent Lon protease